MTLKVLDLCSGIGGFSLGLERTGGFETVAFCEIEEFPRKVLRKHWPEVPIYDDVRTLTAAQLERGGISVDVICAGFPCQDLSIAGKQAGITAKRSGLWSEIARLVGELRPKYVIVENVANLLSGPSEQRGGWFGRVLGDMAKRGYDAIWKCISASDVKYPHERDRVWIVFFDAEEISRVHQSNCWQNLQSRVFNNAITRPACPWDAPEAAVCRVDDGIPDRVDRVGSLGNAVVPQIPEMIGYAILEMERAS